MSTNTIKLYRAMSTAEWTDVQSFGGFRAIPASMQGHWFAESATDARTWADRLYQIFGLPYVIAEVEVPVIEADHFFRLDFLDNIGPARFADVSQLAIINQTKIGDITEVHAQGTGTP